LAAGAALSLEKQKNESLGGHHGAAQLVIFTKVALTRRFSRAYIPQPLSIIVIGLIVRLGRWEKKEDADAGSQDPRSNSTDSIRSNFAALPQIVSTRYRSRRIEKLQKKTNHVHFGETVSW